jgi:hypothetical protein
MASEQRTVTVESVLTQVQINAEARTLTVAGEIRVQGGGTIEQHVEDVTALLDPTDVQAVLRLVNRAQSWIDAKL